MITQVYINKNVVWWPLYCIFVAGLSRALLFSKMWKFEGFGSHSGKEITRAVSRHGVAWFSNECKKTSTSIFTVMLFFLRWKAIESHAGWTVLPHPAGKADSSRLHWGGAAGVSRCSGYCYAAFYFKEAGPGHVNWLNLSNNHCMYIWEKLYNCHIVVDVSAKST